MPNPETLRNIRRYYDQTTGEIPPGTGLVWFMSQDQLHPPMLPQPQFWTSREGWKQGTEETVRLLVNSVGIEPNHIVLDVGCGVGGPGRLIARETGARVIELNLSHTQLVTDRTLSSPELHNNYI